MLNARWIVFEAHTNTVCLFDHVAVRENVSLGVNDYAGPQRTFADGSVAAWPTETGPLLSGTSEEVVEEIIHAAAIVVTFVALALSLSATAPMHVLNRRFGIDIDDTWFQLLRDPREGLRQRIIRRLNWRQG